MVEGLGMPRLGSTARGNLVAVVRVVSPEGLAESDLDAIRQMVEARGASKGDAGEKSASDGSKKKTKFRPHGRKSANGSK